MVLKAMKKKKAATAASVGPHDNNVGSGDAMSVDEYDREDSFMSVVSLFVNLLHGTHRFSETTILCPIKRLRCTTYDGQPCLLLFNPLLRSGLRLSETRLKNTGMFKLIPFMFYH
jgi:hypothetical protein